MNELRIDLRFSNAVLYRALMDFFLDAAIERHRAHKLAGPLPIFKVAAESMQVSRPELNRLLRLKTSPYLPDGSLKKITEQICDYLKFEPNDLFPAELYAGKFSTGLVIETNSDRFIPLSEVKYLQAPDDLEGNAVAASRTAILEDAISELNRRQRKVIRERFGLNGNDEKTQGQIGHDMNLTGSRVGAIEKEAIRRIRRNLRFKGITDL